MELLHTYDIIKETVKTNLLFQLERILLTAKYGLYSGGRSLWAVPSTVLKYRKPKVGVYIWHHAFS